jgi:NAD(P)-dependent dehydrogenase (short-subunit alcohol dehydrogenase family)
MKISECVVVITGSSGGLGRSMAGLLVQRGAKVVLCSRDIRRLKQTAKESGAMAVRANVTRESDLKRVVQKTLKAYGRIDVWVNNAGMWLPKEDLESIDPKKALQLFRTNVFGAIHGMRAAIRVMKRQGFGTILNIISTTAFDGMNGSSGSMYVTSKYALRGLTNVVRDELSRGPVRLIGVYPGGIKTNLFDAAKPGNFGEFMPVDEVAGKIVAHLEKDSPEPELIIARPGHQVPAGRR